jgi:hypothetical protein
LNTVIILEISKNRYIPHIEFSPTLSLSLPPKLQIFSHYTVFKHPQSLFLLQCGRQVLDPYQTIAILVSYI